MENRSILERLYALDHSVLAGIARQDQDCVEFVVTSWSVERLSEKGIANPDGLFVFRGAGYDPAQPGAERTWSVVLKIVEAPPQEGDITNIWYWKREVLAIQAGLLADLPDGGLRPPRFYGFSEQDGGAWVWMEYIREVDPPRWSKERFPEAAYRMGRMHGAYLCGRPLPDYPWLSRDQGVSWTRDSDPESLWDHPVVQDLISPRNLERLQRLWKQRERFYAAYHALPQVFSHGDSGRRNHMFRINRAVVEEMVSIDWAWCGIAPVGWDLNMLLVDSALMYEMEVEDLPGIEAIAIPRYLEGLRSWGWQADDQTVRLGYCVSATLFPLLPVLRGLVIWSGEEMQPFAMRTFGCGFEDLKIGWGKLIEHLLDLGEEALTLLA